MSASPPDSPQGDSLFPEEFPAEPSNEGGPDPAAGPQPASAGEEPAEAEDFLTGTADFAAPEPPAEFPAGEAEPFAPAPEDGTWVNLGGDFDALEQEDSSSWAFEEEDFLQEAEPSPGGPSPADAAAWPTGESAGEEFDPEAPLEPLEPLEPAEFAAGAGRHPAQDDGGDEGEDFDPEAPLESIDDLGAEFPAGPLGSRAQADPGTGGLDPEGELEPLAELDEGEGFIESEPAPDGTGADPAFASEFTDLPALDAATDEFETLGAEPGRASAAGAGVPSPAGDNPLPAPADPAAPPRLAEPDLEELDLHRTPLVDDSAADDPDDASRAAARVSPTLARSASGPSAAAEIHSGPPPTCATAAASYSSAAAEIHSGPPRSSASARRLLWTVGALAGALAVIGFTLTQALRPFGRKGAPTAESASGLPARGRLVEITATDSGWITVGGERGGLRPLLVFSLVPRSDSPDGALRVLFQDAEGKVRSAPANLVVSGGQILSGTERVASIEIRGTEGPKDQTSLVVQRMSPSDRWKAVIYEGGHPQDAFANFTPLLEVPIEPAMLEPEPSQP